VLSGFNAGACEFPRELPVHAQIAQQARLQPQAIALELDEASLTYGELDARANRLAHRLIALGVRPDDRVAVAAERRLETVVGLLAVMKAGGAYVPLDPSYPAERLAFMLADAAPVAVLARPGALAAAHAAACPSSRSTTRMPSSPRTSPSWPACAPSTSPTSSTPPAPPAAPKAWPCTTPA
jgi:non-ribosomal peptide synthetase component F